MSDYKIASSSSNDEKITLNLMLKVIKTLREKPNGIDDLEKNWKKISFPTFDCQQCLEVVEIEQGNETGNYYYTSLIKEMFKASVYNPNALAALQKFFAAKDFRYSDLKVFSDDEKYQYPLLQYAFDIEAFDAINVILNNPKFLPKDIATSSIGEVQKDRSVVEIPDTTPLLYLKDNFYNNVSQDNISSSHDKFEASSQQLELYKQIQERIRIVSVQLAALPEVLLSQVEDPVKNVRQVLLAQLKELYEGKLANLELIRLKQEHAIYKDRLDNFPKSNEGRLTLYRLLAFVSDKYDQSKLELLVPELEEKVKNAQIAVQASNVSVNDKKRMFIQQLEEYRFVNNPWEGRSYPKLYIPIALLTLGLVTLLPFYVSGISVLMWLNLAFFAPLVTVYLTHTLINTLTSSANLAQSQQFSLDKILSPFGYIPLFGLIIKLFPNIKNEAMRRIKAPEAGMVLLGVASIAFGYFLPFFAGGGIALVAGIIGSVWIGVIANVLISWNNKKQKNTQEDKEFNIKTTLKYSLQCISIGVIPIALLAVGILGMPSMLGSGIIAAMLFAAITTSSLVVKYALDAPNPFELKARLLEFGGTALSITLVPFLALCGYGLGNALVIAGGTKIFANIFALNYNESFTKGAGYKRNYYDEVKKSQDKQKDTQPFFAKEFYELPQELTKLFGPVLQYALDSLVLPMIHGKLQDIDKLDKLKLPIKAESKTLDVNKDNWQKRTQSQPAQVQGSGRNSSNI